MRYSEFFSSAINIVSKSTHPNMIVKYDTPAYPADLYGPTYKLDPLDIWAIDSSLNADFANVGDSDSDSSVSNPYPFGYANFFGSSWGSGIQTKLPGVQGCQISCNCCK